MNLVNKNLFDIPLDFDFGLIAGEFGSSDGLWNYRTFDNIRCGFFVILESSIY